MIKKYMAWVLLLGMGLPTLADTVYLKNGSILRGKITEQNPEYIIIEKDEKWKKVSRQYIQKITSVSEAEAPPRRQVEPAFDPYADDRSEEAAEVTQDELNYLRDRNQRLSARDKIRKEWYNPEGRTGMAVLNFSGGFGVNSDITNSTYTAQYSSYTGWPTYSYTTENRIYTDKIKHRDRRAYGFDVMFPLGRSVALSFGFGYKPESSWTSESTVTSPSSGTVKSSRTTSASGQSAFFRGLFFIGQWGERDVNVPMRNQRLSLDTGFNYAADTRTYLNSCTSCFSYSSSDEDTTGNVWIYVGIPVVRSAGMKMGPRAAISSSPFSLYGDTTEFFLFGFGLDFALGGLFDGGVKNPWEGTLWAPQVSLYVDTSDSGDYYYNVERFWQYGAQVRLPLSRQVNLVGKYTSSKIEQAGAGSGKWQDQNFKASFEWRAGGSGKPH